MKQAESIFYDLDHTSSDSPTQRPVLSLSDPIDSCPGFMV
jgi:hypothetical protein